jgi:hypothetical protein
LLYDNGAFWPYSVDMVRVVYQKARREGLNLSYNGHDLNFLTDFPVITAKTA